MRGASKRASSVCLVGVLVERGSQLTSLLMAHAVAIFLRPHPCQVLVPSEPF